jgi:hypothetical protein
LARISGGTKEEVSALDGEGDSEMKDAELAKDGEVVTIPITIEDELADIPPEMRANVAKEIAAFRERSTRRDIPLIPAAGPLGADAGGEASRLIRPELRARSIDSISSVGPAGS